MDAIKATLGISNTGGIREYRVVALNAIEVVTASRTVHAGDYLTEAEAKELQTIAQVLVKPRLI